MTLGLYIHRQSPIHRLPAGAKILALVAASTLLFAIGDWRILAAILAAVAALYRLAGIPADAALAQLRPLAWLLALVFVFQALVAGWPLAVLVVLRLLALVLAACLVTLTTPVSAMIEALERGLGWLRFLGLNPAKISLAISLALRFIPVLADITAQVREAQRARGLEWSVLAVALPVVIRTLKMAEDVSDAIDARGYDP